MKNASYWIEQLNLKPHPEGGFYNETYRAALTVPKSALPEGYAGPRSASTAIYFLLEDAEFSGFHRIPSDEMWHFYAGDPLSVHVIDTTGRHYEIKLGPDPERGECFQAVVPGGSWFGSCLSQGKGFSLVGCTVSPGFDFADFEMAERAALTAQFPHHAEIINRLTR